MMKMKTELQRLIKCNGIVPVRPQTNQPLLWFPNILCYTEHTPSNYWFYDPQGGKCMSRSRANNSKYPALQKKITSNQVRKSALSQALKFKFLYRKPQLPRT